MSTLCPSCGRPDASDRDFCPRCGEYLRWDATEEHPRRVRDAPTVELPTLARSPAVVLLNLDADTARVAAGGLGSLRGTIRNQSGVVDNYEFRVAGLPADWAGPPPTAYLVPFGAGDGSEQDFELALTPPRAPAALAQPWPFTLEAVSRNSGAVVARVAATLIVEPFEELTARTHPQRRRGRRRATYGLEVANLGNAPATVQLAGTDTDDACDVRIDPPALQIEPGRRATAQVRVAPRRTLWWGRPVEHRVNVDAPVPQTLAFRQLAWIPWWVPAAVALLVALAIGLLALRGDPPIPVPEVRGQTVEGAQQLLVDAGFKAKPQLQEQVVGDARQVGRVIAQNPSAGAEVDADGAVLLRAGVANQVVTVPNIRGVTLDQAQQVLNRSGLALGVIDPGDAPRDAVVDFQNPAAGTDARLGSAVNVRLNVAGEATPTATPTPTPTATPTPTVTP